MDDIAQDPSRYATIFSNFCEFFTIKQLQRLSLITPQWKYYTDNIIANNTCVKITKNNIKGLRLTRRYGEFEIIDISSNDLNAVLKSIVYLQAEDVKIGMRTKYLKKLSISRVVLTEATLGLLEELQFVDELCIIGCQIEFDDLNILCRTLNFQVTGTNENQVCKRLIQNNHQHLRNMCIDATRNQSILQPIEAVSYPSLTNITLFNQHVSLEEFFRVNPQITSCSFKCTVISQTALDALQNHCTNLEDLSLHRFGGENLDVHIFNVQKLKTLRLTGMFNVNITNTDFTNLKVFQNNTLRSDLCMPLLEKMPNLTTLDLGMLQFFSRDTNITAQLLSHISKFCPKLEKLVLEKNRNIHLNAQDYEFETFENLQEMDISHTQLSDELLSRLSAPKLVKARISFTCITDKGLEHLSANCPSLEEVYIEDCFGIRDEGVSHLVENLQFLKYLEAENSGSRLTASLFHTVFSKASLSANLLGIRINRKIIEDMNQHHETLGDILCVRNDVRYILMNTIKERRKKVSNHYW